MVILKSLTMIKDSSDTVTTVMMGCGQSKEIPGSPFLCGASEKPYPGMEGHTTSNTRLCGFDRSVSRGINP